MTTSPNNLNNFNIGGSNYSGEGWMKVNRLGLITFFLAIFIFASCDNENNAVNNGPFPPDDPNEWVCPSSLIGATQQEIDAFCSDISNFGESAPLELQNPPLISDLNAKNKFDLDYQEFLRDRIYATELGWVGDKTWRMTGPYVGEIGSGESSGVHPAVRVYYSPEVTEWLCNDRQGDIPDGAMIIKEMHGIDTSLDIRLNREGCMVIEADVEPESWAPIIKQSGASHDGWYWMGFSQASNPVTFAWQVGNPPFFSESGITSNDFFRNGFLPLEPDPLWFPTGYVFSSTNKIPNVVFPYNEYGNYCVNCHASATEELTFSSIENILTDGLQYRQYSSIEPADPIPDELDDGHQPGLVGLITQDHSQLVALIATRGADGVDGYESPFSRPLIEPNSNFLDFYDQLERVRYRDVWVNRLPAQTYDHHISAAEGPDEFLTSDQCIGCHDATYSNASLPNMMFQDSETGELINLSPYGEWSASPMGLAGRDPIFFSQLQSETNNLPELQDCIETTCLHCHGVMGQRQLAIDTLGQDTEGCEELFAVPPPPEVPFGKPFELDMVRQWPNSSNNEFQKYGALARDGISCLVCHRMSDTALGDDSAHTGNFVTGPADELYGPYEDSTIIPKPMQHAIGITPEFRDYFVGRDSFSSDICGSCHNILLPKITNEGEIVGHSYEQTTHLEWVNSDFAPGAPEFQSCADCHMETHYEGQDLSFKIANIQSSDFAPTTNRLPDQDVTLTVRENYARHSLHGLNLFLNQLFQQFPILLGYRQIDYMTGSSVVPSLVTGARSMINMAKNETANIEIKDLDITEENELYAKLKVNNFVGHFFPSGVGFRRVFIEFLVRDMDGNILWASGRTNELGAIVKGITNEVLNSEQPVKFPDEPFQPHYQVISEDDQVQIYQELIKDSDGNLTTSFLRRIEDVKDNRLRPKGYNPELFANPVLFPSPFIQALAETHGEAAFDEYYTNPELTGADLIEYIIPLDQEILSQVHDIQVTLYSQSIPPFYLQQRFRDANRGAAEKEEIERLYYLTSHLNVDDVLDEEGNPVLSDWKLFISTSTQTLSE